MVRERYGHTQTYREVVLHALRQHSAIGIQALAYPAKHMEVDGGYANAHFLGEILRGGEGDDANGNVPVLLSEAGEVHAHVVRGDIHLAFYIRC